MARAATAVLLSALVLTLSACSGATTPLPPEPTTTRSPESLEWLETTSCNTNSDSVPGQAGAEGYVTNLADETVDVLIEVQFLADDGTLVDAANDSVTDVEAGQRAFWSTPYSDSRGFSRCEATVDSVLPSN